MADYDHPLQTEEIDILYQYLRDNLNDYIKMFDSVDAKNIPNDAIRINPSTMAVEKYNADVGEWKTYLDLSLLQGSSVEKYPFSGNVGGSQFNYQLAVNSGEIIGGYHVNVPPGKSIRVKRVSFYSNSNVRLRIHCGYPQIYVTSSNVCDEESSFFIYTNTGIYNFRAMVMAQIYNVASYPVTIAATDTFYFEIVVE